MGREQVSDDLVTRLGDLAARFGKCRDASLCIDAADEIKRLRARTAELERKDASRCETGLPCERLTILQRALTNTGETP